VNRLETRDFSLLGIGLYTVPEASRLTSISQGRLRRWLRGYSYSVGEARATSAPVWRHQVPEIEGALGLGFLDLMEARFVDAFCEASVPWRVIRLCAERAREITGSDHPFSSRRFRTDGRTVFAEVVDKAGEKQLLDLAKNQLAFARVIGPSLYAGIEFSVDDMPARWWPIGRFFSITTYRRISPTH
jgi:helix-turn-helix protein